MAISPEDDDEDEPGDTEPQIPPPERFTFGECVDSANNFKILERAAQLVYKEQRVLSQFISINECVV